MKPRENKQLIEILKATAEIYGKQISATAAVMFLADLDNFSSAQVIDALAKCRRELKFFPSVAEVIARIDDGHVGVEEAWSMIPKNEYQTAVLNDEISNAFGQVRSLLTQDPIAARMAFKEIYQRLVADSRAVGKKPNWWISLGHSKEGRDGPVLEAVGKKRITMEYAASIVHGIETTGQKQKLIGQKETELKQISVDGLLKQMMVKK